MADLRVPFNPMRFRGKGGLLTVEEGSRLQDLIRGAMGDFVSNLNKIFDTFNVSIQTVTTTPGPAGLMGMA